MDIPLLLDKFKQFEEEHKLFCLKIKETLFWDYLRYSVFYSLTPMNALIASGKKNPPKYLEYCKEICGYLAYLIRFYLAPNKKKYDLMVVAYSRTNMLAGKKVHIHLFPILNSLSDLKILLLDPISLDYNSKEIYNCDVIKTRIFAIADRIRALFIRYSESDNKMIAAIDSKIEKRFGKTVSLSGKLKTLFSAQLIKSNRYRRMIKKYKPSLIIYCDDANQKGLIEAAHDCGVKTVDIQHCQISKLNQLYNYPDSIRQYNLNTFSDYVFTFSEFWHDNYNLPINKIAVGFPFIEIKKKEAEKTLLDCGDKSKNIIIFSDELFKSKYEEIAIGLAKSLPDFTIYYKLRDENFNNWQTRYSTEIQATPNIKFIANNQYNLYEYFVNCSFQIGINSTALYEGLMFNLMTFVLKESWYEEMRPVIDAKLGFLVSSVDDIVEKIMQEERPNYSENMDFAFKKNAVSNIKKEIYALISQATVSPSPE